jgi:hydroxymethylpyrimidine/phosphomethylpyrimidine kinase
MRGGPAVSDRTGGRSEAGPAGAAPARVPNILSIAGLDPSGGAGILADVKTFAALGAYGMAVATGLTAQNTRGVSAVRLIEPDFVTAEIEAIFADIRVDAVKIGMVGSAAIAAAVAAALRRHAPPHVVLDPVMVAKGGDRLMAEDAVAAVRDLLVPLAEIVTPNLPEAAVLLGAVPADGASTGSAGTGPGRDGDPPTPGGWREATDLAAMHAQVPALLALGPQAVLLKGGHLAGPDATDLLADPAGLTELPAPRIATKNTHGTGCTLSSAIAALLPRYERTEAVRRAKAYLTEALRSADRLEVGHGRGPVDHLWREAR